MQNRRLYISSLFLFLFTLLQSCSVDVDQAPQKILTTPAFDTLQGKWFHSTTVYSPAFGGSVPFTIMEADSIKFNPDLTGTNHIPQAPVNFMYNLLANDSTLIFNNGSVSNPQYDTVTILALTARQLSYRSKIKTISFPFAGTFYLYSQFNK